MTFQLVEQVNEQSPNGMTFVEYYCRDDVTGAMFMRRIQFPTKTFNQKEVDQVVADKIVQHNDDAQAERPLPAIKLLESLNAILADDKTTADEKVAAISEIHNDEVAKIDNLDISPVPIDVTPIDIVPTPEPVLIASP